MNRPNRLFVPIVLLAIAALCACAGTAWEAALRDDTPAGYYRFMREHPDSPYQLAATERLDFHKLKRDLSLQGFESFVAKYPGSALAESLRPKLEPQAFAVARARGTAEAYEHFIEGYPSGELVARARGNAAYLAAAGFGGRPELLADFAVRHPESDFAKEAARSAESASVRSRSRFERVGLVIDIAPTTPEPSRLRKRFLEHAKKIYDEYGVELIQIPDVVDPAAARLLPEARVVIRHSEAAVQTSMEDGAMSRPGVMATTRVTLRRKSGEPAIFEREFSLRAEQIHHVEGTSVLFSETAPRYWEEFFVPVATWQTSASLRSPVSLGRNVVDVDALGDRAVVLFEDGHFQLIELADPAVPVVLAEYQRPNDLKRWSGVRILGDRVAVFGEEGVEIVRFGAKGPELAVALDRGQIGTVFAIERLGERLVMAGAKGLLVAEADGSNVERVMRRVVKGLGIVGETLIFTDGESLFVSSLKLLAEKRVSAQLRLGRTFALNRVRAFGNRAVAIGAEGVLVLSLADREKPSVIAKLAPRDVGRVHDATAVGEQIFLLGDRGLQAMDARGKALAEFVDVEALGRVASMGRHVVVIGDQRLQVVDSTPFHARTMPAATAE